MKKILTLLFFLLALFDASAQEASLGNKISGTVKDRKTGETMIQATVQLLRHDSTYVSGTVTDDNGLFHISVPADGKYILKFSSIGYKNVTKDIAMSGKDVSIGNVSMSEDAIMLKETQVTGKALKVVLKEDTFVYNASAYRTPEGSVLEELVKRLPGAQISDDGTITINGKQVKKILVDGKEFMTGDTKTAIKNIPTSIIEKVKAYDQKSDLSRVTGIDDGEEQTVLDFGMKKGMNKGMFSNIDLSVGTKGRYAERLMGAYMNGNTRIMGFGNANNTNDMGFPGGGGRGNFGRGRNGLNATKMAAVNFNWEKKDKLTLDGSVRWNHSDGDAFSKSSTENFVSTTGSFGNSINQNYTRSDSWNMQGRLEWKPDTMTDIMFRPSIKLSKSDGRTSGISASYNDNPYLYVTDPLSAASIAELANDSLMMNSRSNNSLSYSKDNEVDGMLQYNRKLGSNGRNVTLRLDGSYSDGADNNLSMNNVHLYQILNTLGTDSTYQTNRYSVTPTKKWSYSAQVTYSEPLWKATFLQFRYMFTYSYNKSDRSTYDFSNLGEDYFNGINLKYRGWDSYLSRLDNPYEDYLDNNLSRYSEYKNYTHQMEVMFRMIRAKYNFNIGFMAQPQMSRYIQDYQGVSVDTTRTVVNFTPTLDFRYRFSKQSNLRINYRGTTVQPTISQLLAITDDSDPLNISMGNPGLKPSFTQNLRLFYNTYIKSHNRAVMTYVNYSNTQNSISDKVSYDATTGGRTTQPENINGNWDVAGAFMFNTSLDTVGVWNINTFTNMNYNNYVSYLAPDKLSSSIKNTTRSMTVGEKIEGSYRNDWLELALDGSFNYTHSRNHLQAQSNLDTWQFAYGGTLGLTAPWGTSISTDLHENSRRGYSDNSMNTNELVWNAQIAQSFLTGKPLSVSLQFYDILRNQSNFSRTISAIQRNDTEYNSINSYVMLHVTYRLSLFGGKNAMMGPGDRDGNGRNRPPMGGGPGFMGGHHGGGFGGPGM